MQSFVLPRCKNRSGLKFDEKLNEGYPQVMLKAPNNAIQKRPIRVSSFILAMLIAPLAAQANADQSFRSELKQHCFRCHGDGDDEVQGKVNFVKAFAAKPHGLASNLDLIEKMDSIREGDRSLLDNTIFTMGSGLGDGSTHQYHDLPIVTAGSGGGRFETGRLIRCQDRTPLANLWLSYAQLMGIKRDRYADSTGSLKELGVATIEPS